MSISVVNCFTEGVCTNPNNINGGSFIRIGVRVSGKFVGSIYPKPREGDDTSRKRKISKEIIFGRVTYYTSSVFWMVL